LRPLGPTYSKPAVLDGFVAAQVVGHSRHFRPVRRMPAYLLTAAE
jgi:hypothetical protein